MRINDVLIHGQSSGQEFFFNHAQYSVSLVHYVKINNTVSASTLTV